MKLYKVEAIVLRTVNIREADLLVVLFSREYGKIRVIAHGACKPTSRKRGFVQPFCYSSFLLRRGREIDTIVQSEGLEFFPDLLKNLHTLGYASYFVDLVENLTAEREANENVFLLLRQVFRFFHHLDLEVMASAFEMKLITFLGYRPVLQHCVNCHKKLTGGQIAFSVSSGGVICFHCSKTLKSVSWCQRGTLEIMKVLLRWELARLENLKVGVQAKKELNLILKNYIEYHLGYHSKVTDFLKRLSVPLNPLNNDV